MRLNKQSNPPIIEKIDGAEDASIVVHIPPQNILETTEVSIPQEGEDPPPSNIGETIKTSLSNPGQVEIERSGPYPPLPALISGPSRLVFKLPNTIPSIPFTLKSLLNWIDLEQKVITGGTEQETKIR